MKKIIPVVLLILTATCSPMSRSNSEERSPDQVIVERVSSVQASIKKRLQLQQDADPILEIVKARRDSETNERIGYFAYGTITHSATQQKMSYIVIVDRVGDVERYEIFESDKDYQSELRRLHAVMAFFPDRDSDSD